MQKLKTISICVILFFICVIPAYREVGVVYAQPEKSVIISPWPGKPKNLTEDTQFDGDVSGKYNDLQIKEGAVGSLEVADGSVTGEKISDNAVTPEKIRDNSISTEKLQDNSVTDEKVSDDITVSNYLPLTGGSLTGAFSVQGNVGIGTASPQAKLDVNGGARFNGLINYAGVEGTIIQGDATTSSGQFHIKSSDGTKSIHLGFDPIKNLGFMQAIEPGVAYRAITINPDGGNVGIGTTSPSEKLQVSGNVKADSFMGDGSQLSNIQATSINPESDITVSDLVVNGNLGIGTTGPSLSLSFGTANPAIGVETTDGYDNKRLLLDSTMGATTSRGAHISITGNEYGIAGQGGQVGIVSGLGNGATNGADITFHSNKGFGQYEIMRLQGSTGNVGIGSTSPSASLTINGTTKQLQLEYDIDNYQTLTVQNDGSLHIAQDGETATLALTNGRVGIGTLSPSEKLQVSGNVKADSFMGDGSQLSNIQATSINPESDITVSDLVVNGNVGIGTTNPGAKLHVDGNVLLNNNQGIIIRDVGGADRDMLKLTSGNVVEIGSSALNTNVIFRNTGNIGIGTTSPEEKLQISGGKMAMDLNSTSSGYTFGGRADLGIFNPESYHLYQRSPNNIYLDYNIGGINYGDLVIRSNSSDKVIIDQNGNVGIGTTSPSEKLQVSGNIKADSFIGDGSQLTNIQATSINPESDITVSDLVVNGNLGIGTTGPTGKLNIRSASESTEWGGSTALSTLTLESASNYPAIVFREDSAGTGEAYIRISNDAFLDIATVGVNRHIVLQPSGNVGIGTVSPGEKLEVNGNLLLRGNEGKKIAEIIDGGTLDPGYLKVYSNDAIVMQVGGNGTYFNQGNVGIGTLNPSEKLQVLGNVKADSFLGDGSQLTNIQATSINPESDITVSDLVVNGNLGIGTTGPSLSLSFGTANPAIGVETTDGYDNKRLLLDSTMGATTSRGAHISITGNEYGIAGQGGQVGIVSGLGNGATNGADITFHSNKGFGQYEIMRLQGSTGNVGIGTVSPGAKLDVDGAIKIGSVSLDSNAARGTITFDDEFIYVKTSGGWKKARLCSLE